MVGVCILEDDDLDRVEKEEECHRQDEEPLALAAEKGICSEEFLLTRATRILWSLTTSSLVTPSNWIQTSWLMIC